VSEVYVIGAGLAGSEAAWQVARAGLPVKLIEMRPQVSTPAHHTELFAELVCSNSLRAAATENAVGLLKEEMRRMDSLIMTAADASRVPAGGAHAVDRNAFSQYVTDKLHAHPLVTVIHSEVVAIPGDRPCIIASGPLTSPSLATAIAALTGKDYLYFYDAAAPILTADSLNREKIYLSSRYGKGTEDYLNCPMTKQEYEIFWHELVHAPKTPVREFEKALFFEGCMPIEEMALRGIDTLRFGPLKPVGLRDPRTGQIPYAVVQLRQDNYSATLYNMVGFQTHLKWGEQSRIFQLIPGLEQAQFVRLGVMHRNTFINSPQILEPTMQMQDHPGIFFAGQITGVEGYVESAASGLVAGRNAVRQYRGQELLTFPAETAHGALCGYVADDQHTQFQPMNVNFGIFPSLIEKIRDKKQRNAQIAARALLSLQKFIEKSDNNLA
jgi:methylenetetrahydrofolate--tRNA-(uracil-5-)-methyltransferase